MRNPTPTPTIRDAFTAQWGYTKSRIEYLIYFRFNCLVQHWISNMCAPFFKRPMMSSRDAVTFWINVLPLGANQIRFTFVWALDFSRAPSRNKAENPSQGHFKRFQRKRVEIKEARKKHFMTFGNFGARRGRSPQTRFWCMPCHARVSTSWKNAS